VTVEKYLKTKRKERKITRAAHHSIPAFIGRSGLKNTLEPNTRKESKEQHITQSLLHRWELGRTVEKYS
jgi:hypothetical protein